MTCRGISPCAEGEPKEIMLLLIKTFSGTSWLHDPEFRTLYMS